MKTLDGVEIQVGMQVYLLQVPILGQHEFKIGTVTKLSERQVTVLYAKRDRWSRGDENRLEEVRRYPEQLLAV